MADIFDTIGAGVEKLVGNPYVQGMGLMAATGFNPLIGLLAGPIIKDDRQRSEMELEAQRRQLDAQKRLGDLSSTMVQRRIPGMELLGIEGTGGEPTIIPGYTTRSEENLVPLLQTPRGRAELTGIAADLSPGAAVLGGRATEREMIGRRLLEDGVFTPEQFQQYMMGGAGGATSPLEMALGLALLNQRSGTESREAEEAALEAQQRQQAEEVFSGELLGSFDQLIELGMLNTQLAGSSFATRQGLPGGEARRAVGSTIAELGEALDFDTSDMQQDIGARDVFTKTAANIQFDLLKDANVDSRAARILERFFKGTASLDIGPAANYKIIADQLRGRLRVADAKGIEIPQEQRAQIMAAIQLFEEQGNALLGQGEAGGADYQFTPEGELIRTGDQQ
jgi:hypothetical protein